LPTLVPESKDLERVVATGKREARHGGEGIKNHAAFISSVADKPRGATSSPSDTTAGQLQRLDRVVEPTKPADSADFPRSFVVIREEPNRTSHDLAH
jgi:hypothetical protein